MTVSLTPRLQAIVDNVIPCNTAVDVGCDHAYVGVYLTQTGKVKNMTVSDINEGPIENAREAVFDAGLSDRITCIRCDGLEGIVPQDTVIIAGMGGELIRDILKKAEWTQKDTRLILQPMSMGDVLRKFLFENGYRIIKEDIAIEKERVYAIIVAEGGKCDGWSDADLYLSDLSHKDAPIFLDKTIKRMSRILMGMEMAENADNEQIESIKKLISELAMRRDRRGK